MGLDIYGCKSVRKSKARHEDDFYQIEDKNIDFLSPLLDRIEEKEFEYFDVEKIFGDKCEVEGYYLTKSKSLFLVNGKEYTFTEKEINELPMLIEKEKVLYFGDEFFYQRNGMDDRFYEDYEKGILSAFIATKEKVDYLLQYCINKEDRIRMKSDLCEKFVEGEDFVFLSW